MYDKKNDFFINQFIKNKDTFNHSEKEQELLASLFELHNDCTDVNLDTNKGTIESLKELLIFNALLKIPSFVITNYTNESKDKKTGSYFLV